MEWKEIMASKNINYKIAIEGNTNILNGTDWVYISMY